jgi:hypothetical protein
MLKKVFIIFLLTISINKNAFCTEIWNSENGISRLNSSQYKNDFYQVANFYQAQNNPIHCSSATALMLKNAFFYEQIPSQSSAEITKPNGEIIPFKLFNSQENFFNEKTDKIKSRDIIYYKKTKIVKNKDGTTTENYDPGLNLKDFAKILKINKIKSKIFYQESDSEQDLTKFREIAKKILNDKKSFLVVNFDGKVFGNKTGGHISPIVAYDEKSDSLLVLDVALHKNPWYWVDLKEMVKAMNTKDGENYRGYLVVKKSWF